MKKRILIGVATAGLMWLAASKLYAKVEEPSYRVVQSYPEFEIRAYGGLILAETLVEDSYDKTREQGFKRLAGYIFGANKPIAMTAPVGLTEQEPTRIAMTAPVGMATSPSGWRMTFTMPAGSTLENLPRPDDTRVTLREVPPRSIAVLKFSGQATESLAKAQSLKLREALARESWVSNGEAELQQYNPPWTPPFLRRNEIWIEVEEQKSNNDLTEN
jgi:hypothetical protein